MSLMQTVGCTERVKERTNTVIKTARACSSCGDNACICRLSFTCTIITTIFVFSQQKKKIIQTHNLWKQLNNPPGTKSLWNCMNFSNKKKRNEISIGWLVSWSLSTRCQRKKIRTRDEICDFPVVGKFKHVQNRSDACHLPECLSRKTFFIIALYRNRTWKRPIEHISLRGNGEKKVAAAAHTIS